MAGRQIIEKSVFKEKNDWTGKWWKKLTFQGITQEWNWVSSVGVAGRLHTDWTVRGSNSGRGKKFFGSPKLADWLCGLRSLIPGLFPGGKEPSSFISCWGKGEILHTHPDRPQDPPNPCTVNIGSISRDRAAGEWRWPLWGRGWQWVVLYLNFPYVSAWHVMRQLYLFNPLNTELNPICQ